MRFLDRADAGRRLADRLRPLELRDPVVLALPRGGLPVAWEVAQALDAPLDAFVARKVGAPGQPELGIGAVAEGDGAVVVQDAARSLGLSAGQWDELVAQERRELDRRVQLYRGGRAPLEVKGRDVVLVDDGLATGVTAEAALVALRTREPRRLVLAIPACAPQSAQRLSNIADEVVCVISPPDFYAVGQWYETFGQTSDEEVRSILASSASAGH